ncbi:MAG: oprP [Myxococcales bacterium]|nr:oprP [Myxococcales bacterium]
MRQSAIAGLVGLALLWARPAQAQDPTSVEERLAAQEARIRELELRISQSQLKTPRLPQTAPPAPPSPSANLAPSLTPPASPPVPLFGFSWSEGLWVGRPDVVQIRFHALVQADTRLYFDTDTIPIPNQLLLRRVRPMIEGTLFDFADFRIMPDFGNGNAVVQDAFVDLHPFRGLALRAGKFKTAVGLEWLQGDPYLMLLERSLATNLVPNRDVGAALHGDIGGGIMLYELAVMNGAPDGANLDSDINDGKDGIARLFFHPLRGIKSDAVRYLGLGIGGSYGKQHGTPTVSGLPSYRTFGQNTWFSYVFDPTGVRATSIAIGDRYRFSPQAYWFVGPVGILAEYVYSATTVTGNLGTLEPKVTIVNQAWNAQISCFVTGDRAGWNGPKVKRPFSIKQRHFGALELAGRYAELRIDPAAFPTYADPTRSAKSALEWALGFNWYLTDGIKIAASYARTTFDGGAGAGDRRPENALVGRIQLTF